LNDFDAFSAANVVSDLSSVGFVVHEEEVKFADVVHEELLEAIRKEMACLQKRQQVETNWIIMTNLFVAAVSNL